MARRKAREVPFISIERLSLDDANPRFSESLSQAEMLAVFAADEKTSNLARHMATYGIDPTSNLAIMPGATATRYVVREGNRRLAAAKLLNNPSLAKTAALIKRFQKIASDAKRPLPAALPCVLFEGDDADEWIALKHSGPATGEGTLGWDAQQRTNFNLRTGRADQNQAAHTLIEHAVHAKWITRQQADGIGISNITRLLNDVDVQAIWGVSAGDKSLSVGFDAGHLQSFVVRLAQDWKKRTGKKKVGDIYHKADRLKYAQEVVKDLGVKIVDQATTIGEKAASGGGAGTTGSQGAKPGKPATPKPSKTIVPTGFHVQIDNDRARDVFAELRRLPVEEFVNAVAMLFRTFVEWSSERYCETHDVKYHQEATLADKVQKAVGHMKGQSGVDRKTLEPIDQIVSTPKSIYSIKTFNHYVHNIHQYPAPSDLKAHFKSMAPFLKLAWEI